MPSFSHELLVDLFRQRGELAPMLLSVLAGIELAHARVEQGSIDLSQVAPTEYRADSVVVLRDHDNKLSGALIVEVQLGADAQKRYSWPAYLATLRATHHCPVVLLVIAPDPAIARWAREPIVLGHPGFALTPLVYSFEDLPRSIDRDIALRLPELAVLAHPQLDIAEIALEAISATSTNPTPDAMPEERRKVYFDVVLAALSSPDRKTLEARMEIYRYRSDFGRKIYGHGIERGIEQGIERGIEQGIERGIEQGIERGIEQGIERGLRAALRALLHAKLGTVSPDDEAAIDAVPGDAAAALIEALVRATSADEVRAALTRAAR